MTLIMQNKANYKRAKMNANAFSQKVYENETTLRPQKNKPNQTQFQKSTNEYKLNFNKGLQKKR